MSETTICDLAITEIVNCMHECSKVAESIECKTEFTQRSMLEEPSEPSKPGPGTDSATPVTPLAGEFARVKQTVDNLLERLINLDNSIFSTVTELKPDKSE